MPIKNSELNQENIEKIEEKTLYEIADFFKAFSDSTRIKILYELLDKDLSVTVLTENLQMSQSAISHQLKQLRLNKLVKYKKEGKNIIYSLDDSHVSTLLEQALNHLTHSKYV